jgi:hypothetical protein
MNGIQMGPYTKPVVWAICIAGGMGIGYIVDNKYFGVLEGGFGGLIAGAFATAYIDAQSLPPPNPPANT